MRIASAKRAVSNQFAQNSPMVRVLFLFVVIALGMGLAAPLRAQTDTGSIVGTVSDASGAIVPGDKVDITNAATNVTQSVVTNAARVYQALQLIPGTYYRAARQGEPENQNFGFAGFLSHNVRSEERRVGKECVP